MCIRDRSLVALFVQLLYCHVKNICILWANKMIDWYLLVWYVEIMLYFVSPNRTKVVSSVCFMYFPLFLWDDVDNVIDNLTSFKLQSTKKSRSTYEAFIIFGAETFLRHDIKHNFYENMKIINSLICLKNLKKKCKQSFL